MTIEEVKKYFEDEYLEVSEENGNLIITFEAEDDSLNTVVKFTGLRGWKLEGINVDAGIGGRRCGFPAYDSYMYATITLTFVEV